MILVSDLEGKVPYRADYDSHSQRFYLSTPSNDDIFEYDPIIDMVSEYNPSDYELFLLKNKREDYGENCIYQVWAENNTTPSTRIGWIFPIQALESTEHDYADNIHFLKYAFVAIQLLLNMEKEIRADNCCVKISLQDMFHMDETVMVLCRENTEKLAGFDIKQYTYSLFSYGYSFSGDGNLFNSCEMPVGTKIRLKPLSDDLQHITYLLPLFMNSIPNAADTISKFFLCYQAIEILIGEIFNVEFQCF